MFMLLLLLACKDKIDGPPTDTFPVFFGEVPQNVLMISIDTFRRDEIPWFGGPESNLPFLHSIMKESMVMEHHTSCSDWTFVAVTCATWGMRPDTAGFLPKMFEPYREPIPDGPTLAARLSGAGYLTMLSSSNGWFSAEHNTSTGYDLDEMPENASTTGVFAQALERLKQAKADGQDRWFAHLHVKEPHSPYNPPTEYLKGIEDLPYIPYNLADKDEQYDLIATWANIPEDEREAVLQHMWFRYRAELRWMDDQLAAGWKSLEQAGFLDDTMVVFWNDHGEQFWEHGYNTHAYTLHREENDGMFVVWAKNIQAGRWIGPTTHIDIAPTILDLLGQDWDGMDGTPLGQAPDDRVIDGWTVARLGPIQSVTRENWKLIYDWNTGTRKMFDRNSDWEEGRDLYSADDPEAQSLWQELLPRIDAFRAIIPEYTPTGIDE